MTTPLPYPTSLPDFMAIFPSEDACSDYLFKLRWPDGFKCPACPSREGYWLRTQRKLECKQCGKHTYLTAGTVFHKTHTPLKTWFLAAYLVTSHTPGMSATQAQFQLGLRRYETAFQILHKLRAAMVNPGREPLHGEIEVDETFVGGQAVGGKGGRSTNDNKAIVVGAVERRYRKEGVAAKGGRRFYAGRLRMRIIPDTTAKSLTHFVQDHIDEGTFVLTDAWGGYNHLSSRGYQHEPMVEGDPRNASKILPLIHLEFSNLKTWLLGIHHGRVEHQHLQAYLNEFCFRHNRRFWKDAAFLSLLKLAIGHKPQTYENLYRADELGRNIHAA